MCIRDSLSAAGRDDRRRIRNGAPAISGLAASKLVPATVWATVDQNCQRVAPVSYTHLDVYKRQVLRLGWWLPGLWILARALDVEREVASDERAVRAAGVRRYAACLLRLATSAAPAALSPAFRGRRAQVAIRVERLLRPRPEPCLLYTSRCV